MTTQHNPLEPSIELFRNLSATTLSGSEEIFSWHLNHTQEFIGRSAKQLRETLSNISSVQKPENWSQAVGNGIRSALEISREYAIAASNYQRERYAVLQQQAIEAQKKISESMAEQFTRLQGDIAHQKRAGKHAAANRTAAE